MDTRVYRRSLCFRNLLSHLGRPSRPASAYLLYCSDRRKGLPGTPGKIAAEWKEMSEAKKEVSLEESLVEVLHH